MKAVCVYFGVVLAFLFPRNCVGQQSDRFVYVEGKAQKADGAPWAGTRVFFSNGSSVVTNSSGHYFNVLPAGFTGSSTADPGGFKFSPLNRSYTNVLADQVNQDFTGGAYIVTAGIFTRYGASFPGVALYFDGFWQGAVSDGRGAVFVEVPEGYSGTITPLSIGSTFNPSDSSYTGPSGRAFTQASFANEDTFWSISSLSQTLCYYTASSYLFPPTTAAIYVHVLGFSGTVNFSWYDPSGTLRRQTSYTLPAATNCAVSSINVAGTDIAQSPGLWRVDFQWTGSSFPGSSGSIPFAVLPQKPPSTIQRLGSMAHLASGDGWDSTIELVNTGGSAAQANIGFVGDDGNPLLLPVAPNFPPTASVLRTLSPNATLVVDSTSPGALQTGYAQLTTDTAVGGFIRFRYAPRDQEAIVPLETRNANSYILAFDNTNGIATGVAIANLLSAPVNVPVLIRDNTGAQIGSGSVPLPANGHADFVLTDKFTSTVNQTGTIEFDSHSGGQISVLGLRFPSSGRFTTIPVLANTDPGGGSLPHLAVGDGWTTTIELVNSGTTVAQANLSFFNDSGASLSLPWTVLGNSTPSPVLNQTLAPHARLVVQSKALPTDPLQVGSAQLTTDGNISGFIRFFYGPRNQEAIVPIEARNAGSYILPFDNTNGLVAGVAVANGVGAPISIPIVIRDGSGARIGLGIVALAGNAHTAFVLSDQFPIAANQSGTIEFGSPANARLSVLGFRFPQSGAFSTIPVLAP